LHLLRDLSDAVELLILFFPVVIAYCHRHAPLDTLKWVGKLSLCAGLHDCGHHEVLFVDAVLF